MGGVQLGDHEPVFDIVDGKMNLQYFAATGATAASGRNREPRLGPWPAGHECRSRHEVDAGSHNPFGGMDLQLFADGDGGAAGEGGAEATPAVQEPALRPAQERLARRSGALRGKASPAEQPPQLSGQPEMQPQEGEKPTEEKPQEQKAEKTPEEKRKAFGALVRDGGEYSDIFNEVMQQAIIKAGEAVHTDPQGGCPAAGAERGLRHRWRGCGRTDRGREERQGEGQRLLIGMVTSDKTGDEDTEGAINELADDLLKGDSESVTDALESVRAKDAQEELDRLLRAGKSLSSMKSKITAVCKPEYVAGSEYDRTQLDEMLLALRDADNNPLYTQKTLDSWVSDAEKKSAEPVNDPWADLR